MQIGCCGCEFCGSRGLICAPATAKDRVAHRLLRFAPVAVEDRKKFFSALLLTGALVIGDIVGCQ